MISARSGSRMYKHCFCVNPNPAAAAAGETDKPPGVEETTPPIPPARRQYSQFGQYKYQNYAAYGTHKPGGSTSIGGGGSGAFSTHIQKGYDENNKRVQCEECKHDEYFEWNWDNTTALPTTSVFAERDRNVLFNPGFSVGTGAVRGSKPLELGKHHFFEILMNTEVYGTDMMIGVGTDKVNLQQFAHSFVHFLGYDAESWGLSYSGDVHHSGHVQHYTMPFSQGTYVGVHVDMWNGTLEYYINRRPMGKAFTGLQNKTLYPMISSTAARSGMNLTYCRSFTPTLQLRSLLALAQSSSLTPNESIAKCGYLPPGLKSQVKKQFWWITAAGKNNNTLFPGDANKENSKLPVKVDRHKVHHRRAVKKLVQGVLGDGEETGAGPSSATSSAIPESHSNGNGKATEEGGGSPVSSDSESRDTKRIRLRGASLTQDSE